MIEYYSRRAPIYEKSYPDDPEKHWPELVGDIQAAVQSKRTIEIACGTGYWTGIAARSTASILATDASAEMLEEAKKKNYPKAGVEFEQCDAFQLTNLPGAFEAAYAIQWFSHVSVSDYDKFLESLHSKMPMGSKVLFADNIRRPDDDDPIYKKGLDTFELRTLPDGTEYEIIKNYFDEDKLRSIFDPYAAKLEVSIMKNWWWVTYETKEAKPTQ